MRILPSQSRVMKPKVGSTVSLVMVSAMSMDLGDGGPPGHGRATERVDPDAQAGAGDGRHVDDRRQAGHVGGHEVVAGRRCPSSWAGTRATPSTPEASSCVGRVLDRPRHRGVGRAAAGRVVLEAAVGRRIVRGRDHDAVGAAAWVLAVPGQDGVRDAGRRRVAIGAVDADVDLRSDQDLQGRQEGRLAERVGVAAHEERSRDALRPPERHDGRGGGHDVGLVEGRGQRGAAMTRRAEGHPLGRLRGVGAARVVGVHERSQVDEDGGVGRLSGELARGHGSLLVRCGWCCVGRRSTTTPAGYPGVGGTFARCRLRPNGTWGSMPAEAPAAHVQPASRRQSLETSDISASLHHVLGNLLFRAIGDQWVPQCFRIGPDSDCRVAYRRCDRGGSVWSPAFVLEGSIG